MAGFSLKSMLFQRKCYTVTSCVVLTTWAWKGYFIFHQTVSTFYA